MEYLRDPDAIYAASFATIRQECDFSAFPADAQAVAVRIVHSCGMTDILSCLRISENFVSSAKKALFSGRPILVDAEMVRHGIMPRFMKNNDVVCTLNDPRARETGLTQKTTRSAAAVTLWRDHLAGSVAVIGNAPTALFALLEMIDSGAPKPAAIVAMPVGFVGAVESKDELIRNNRGVPFITVLGRRGGSAMASATINALLEAH